MLRHWPVSSCGLFNAKTLACLSSCGPFNAKTLVCLSSCGPFNAKTLACFSICGPSTGNASVCLSSCGQFNAQTLTCLSSCGLFNAKKFTLVIIFLALSNFHALILHLCLHVFLCLIFLIDLPPQTNSVMLLLVIWVRCWILHTAIYSSNPVCIRMLCP